MCLRLRLQPTEVGKSLVKGWIASKQLEDRKKELIHQMNTGDRKTLYREYRQVTAQVSKMVRTLRTDVMKYLLLANVSDVAVEDIESYFHPVLHQETLLQIKDILKNNNHPIMSFLCESPELCAENQEVLGCVFIF